MINDDILALINKGAKDQQSLLEELNKLGHKVTQSTISRKLKQLGIIKIAGKYQISSLSLSNNEYLFVAPNLFIIKTAAGNAQAVAAKIDRQIIGKHPAFIATIAGDDTIFLACNIQEQSPEELMQILKRNLS
jgi:transcriptional regulator of arginine metabolism